MLALFRNPLLRLIGRLWWLPALTFVATWGLGGEQGWRWASNGVVAYLAIVAGMIGAAWIRGAFAARRELARLRSAQHRFLCPHCLHFSGFHFACGACNKQVEDFLVHTRGDYVNDCRHCKAELLAYNGVKAYCNHCDCACDRTIYHQRQVRVLATLLPDDFTSLRQVLGVEVKQAQGNVGYVCDDNGTRLTYLLNLSSLIDAARSLAHAHAFALWNVVSIWLNADGDAHTVALKVGKAADRFEEQTGRAKRLTVCVPQTSLSIEVKNVLETRFGKIRYSVTAADILGRKEDLRMPAESIGSGIIEPVLRAEVGPVGTMTRKQDSQ